MTTYLKNNPPLFDFDFGLRLKSPKSPLEFTHFLNAKVHFTPINKG